MLRSSIALLALALMSPGISPGQRMAVAQFDFHVGTLLPASRVALQLNTGVAQQAAVAGEGRIEDGYYVVPDRARPGDATLVAAGGGALAVRTIRIVAPPRRPAIAVASYDDGIVFHDPRTFRILGTLATGGAPSDVAASANHLFATDTDGDSVTSVTIAPWSARRLPGVLFGDELVADVKLHALFVTQRGAETPGGVARIDRRGAVTRVVTGTAEGIALDERTQCLYVADTDRGDVAIVDARTMRVLRRLRGVPRAFGIALSTDGVRLYVVSNQGSRTVIGGVGRVTEFSLEPYPRVVARSKPLPFPVGVSVDDNAHRIFVTDELANTISVLDSKTLRAVVPPIRTCSIPWKPDYDARTHRLFVPCAGSDEIDAIDTHTLRRVHDAPFRTGGYPLAVAFSH
jgi:DNA-binding beta-propeller fold protein YncE